MLLGLPFEVFLLQLRIGGCLGLLGDRLNGLGAIDGLLRARNIRQTGAVLLSEYNCDGFSGIPGAIHTSV